MLKSFRKGRKSLSRASIFQRFRKRTSTDSELGPTHWNLPLPPDIMDHIIDTYNDIPIDIPTILALAQSYPVLQPFCFSKIFQNLYISCMAGRTFPDFEFLAHVIQAYPFVLERVKSLTLEGPFERRHLTGSSYVLSQITERSHNLGRLSLAHSIRTWEDLNETLRKHILILLSQNRLHTVALCFYWIPVELLNHLPDLKRLEVDRLPNRSALNVVPVRARKVKVEELALINVYGIGAKPILHPKSPFDFSTLRVFEAHKGWMVDIQEIVNTSAASLRKLVLDVCDNQSAYCVSPNIMINRGKQISILASFLASNTSHYLSILNHILKYIFQMALLFNKLITPYHRPNSNSSRKRWRLVNPTTALRGFALPSAHFI